MIYIDYLSSVRITDNIAKYTGGTNFTKSIIQSLIKRENLKFGILVPENLDIRNFMNIKNDNVTFIHSNSIENVDYSDADVFFLPQVNGTTLFLLPKIKKKYPDLKIYGVLHDRQHNYYKYDWLDKYYYSGLKRIGIIGFFEYYIKRLVFDVKYGSCIQSLDKVFTVSNYSMQKLMHKKVKNIKYFKQYSMIVPHDNEDKKLGDFILLVGGDRPEKNFLRTLIAYVKFIKESNSNTKFIVTGINSNLERRLIGYFKDNIDKKIIKDNVKFYPYVSYNKLSSLYSSCKYVIFTSKGEGYGLPVREAMSYGKAVLASRTTSVPEVAGSILYYVDPFNINSICEGFKKMDDSEFIKDIEKNIKIRSNILNELEKQDIEIITNEIIY